MSSQANGTLFVKNLRKVKEDIMDTTFLPGTYSPLQLVCATEEALQVTSETYDNTLQGYVRMLGVFEEALNAFEAVNGSISLCRGGVPFEFVGTSLQYGSMMSKVIGAPELGNKDGLSEEMATCRERIQEVRSKLSQLPLPSVRVVNLAHHLKEYGLLVMVPKRIFTIGEAMVNREKPAPTRFCFRFT
jgi:hypothetical protein